VQSSRRRGGKKGAKWRGVGSVKCYTRRLGGKKEIKDIKDIIVVLAITNKKVLYFITKLSPLLLSMLVLGITSIENLVLYYKIVTAPTFYVSSKYNQHRKSCI